MPRLSVILPAHNAAAYVGAAVTSTLKALPRDGEIVVYDDASTDDTARVVQEITDPRVRLADDRGKRGLVGALNHLLEITDSEYVARMDADDVCFPWRFTRQLAAVRRTPVVFSALVPFGAGRAPLPGAPTPLQGLGARLALLIDNPFSHPSMLARRAALELVGGYAPGAAEDWDLWLRLACADVPMIRLGVPCLAMRFHPASMSAEEGYRQRLVAEPQLLGSWWAHARRELGPDVPEGDPADLFRRRADALAAPIAARAAALDPFSRAIVTASLRRSAALG